MDHVALLHIEDGVATYLDVHGALKDNMRKYRRVLEDGLRQLIVGFWSKLPKLDLKLLPYPAAADRPDTCAIQFINYIAVIKTRGLQFGVWETDKVKFTGKIEHIISVVEHMIAMSLRIRIVNGRVIMMG